MDLALQSAFVAEESTLLVLLAGAVLLYRSFREKYLVLWIIGWTVYGLAKLFALLGNSAGTLVPWSALANASFVFAIGLFAASVFLYVQRKHLIFPASLVVFVTALLGIAVPLYP